MPANRSLFDLIGLKCSRVTQFFSTSVLLIHLLRKLSGRLKYYHCDEETSLLNCIKNENFLKEN